MRTGLARVLLALPLLATACRTAGESPALPSESSRDAERRAIEAVLDDWHHAASQADGERYFGHMTADAVFLGTDASERWTRDQFRAYCEPYFSKGHGWTYEPRERHVVVEGASAWFDERLWNEKYGECRGTGVLRREAGEWRLAHYSLTMPVPNELAGEVARLIRER